MSQLDTPPVRALPAGAFVIGQVIGNSDRRDITTKKGARLTMVTTQVLAGTRFTRCTQMFRPGEEVREYKHGDHAVLEIIPDLDADGQLVVNTQPAKLS